jgi:hypothetical protein
VPLVRASESGIARGLGRKALFWPSCALVLFAAGASCASKVGLQSDGSYILDRGELGMDCQRLSNSIWGRLQILKSLPDKIKAEREAAAPTAFQAIGRMFGTSTQGLVNLKEYDRERAHVRSLHRQLVEKGCPPVDVEREIASTDAAVAPYRR